jgi:hypothetical protein
MSRSCPVRALANGHGRSEAVNSGFRTTGPELPIRPVPGRALLPGRAFQARDRGATSGPPSTRRSRTTADTGGRTTQRLSSVTVRESQVIQASGFSLAHGGSHLGSVRGHQRSGGTAGHRPSSSSSRDDAHRGIQIVVPKVVEREGQWSAAENRRQQRTYLLLRNSSNPGLSHPWPNSPTMLHIAQNRPR